MTGAWALATRNLTRNRRRSLATVAAIAFGYAGLMLLGGYVVRVEDFLRVNAIYLQRSGHLSIYKEGGLEKAGVKPRLYNLPRAEADRVARILAQEPQVDFVARYLKGMGLLGNGCRSVPFMALGVEPAAERRILEQPELLRTMPEHAATLKGRPVWALDRIDGAVALSTGLAALVGKPRVHDELPPGPVTTAVPDCAAPDIAARLAADANLQLAGLTFEGSLSAIDGELVSVFRTALSEAENSSLITSLPALQRLYDTESITYLAVFLRPGADGKLVERRLGARLQEAGLAVSIYRFDDEHLNPYYIGSMTMLGSIALFIMVLVVAVVSLAILNVMTLTVLERSREIGMFRALGFTRGQMLGLFVREAVLLSGAAVLTGATGGALVAAIINRSGIRFRPPGISGTLALLVTPTPGVCLLLAAMVLPLAVLATVNAARTTTRKRVVRLLTEAVT